MFSKLVGQIQAATILQDAVTSGRLPGAYLFTGPSHTGKAYAAILLAEALNCTFPDSTGKPCGRCPSCAAIAKGTHPDVRTVAPTGPSRILRIPQFWPRDGVKDFPSDRAMLRDLHFAAVLGKKRVFIIEDADALNEDTGNSLLKVLEEPPPYALFVLTATSTGSVLPTIASRCQVIRFTRIPVADIEAVLERNHGLDSAKVAFLAGYCEGAIGEAIRLASHPALFEARGVLLDLAADLTSGAPIIQAFQLADGFRKASDTLGASEDGADEKSTRVSLTRGLDLLAIWYADLLRERVNPSLARLVNADRRTQLSTHARHFDESSLHQAIRLVMDTRRYVERNANAQIAIEVLATQLLHLPRRSAA
jgi:DNA polymerase-3 subunit delta'